MNNEFKPIPIDLSDVVLDSEFYRLSEIMAENAHEIWAADKIREGFSYAPVRDDTHHPCLVPYSKLPESEKEYDRTTSLDTLKLLTKLNFCIRRK